MLEKIFVIDLSKKHTHVYIVGSRTKRVELYIAQVHLIYLTSLIFNSSSTHLVHEPSSTNQLPNRVPNYFRVGSVRCQP